MGARPGNDDHHTRTQARDNAAVASTPKGDHPHGWSPFAGVRRARGAVDV